MTISAKVICDSISNSGARLTSMIWRYNWFAHPEILTHRALSRNAASSRAIPIKKLIEQARLDPAYPVSWNNNRPGMQAGDPLSEADASSAKEAWDRARLAAISEAERLSVLNVHKEISNRILMPFLHITVLVTATEYDNFYFLRNSTLAQPEISELARVALAAHNASVPIKLNSSEWHLPFITQEEKNTLSISTQIKCSTARCARISYLRHDGQVPDVLKDIELHDRLISDGHMSPTEHIGTPLERIDERSGNFLGFLQYRKTIENEVCHVYPNLKKFI